MTTVLGGYFQVVIPTTQSQLLTRMVSHPHQPPCSLAHTFQSYPGSISDYAELLSEDALRMNSLPNAGGNSIFSEILSIDILNKVFHGRLRKTEMEIQYNPMGGPITDYSCIFNWGEEKVIVGVSVTRAMRFKAGVYSKHDAELLLYKKLYGIIMSSYNVVSEDRWEKQILHVFCPSQHIGNVLQDSFESLPPSLKTNTVLLITITDNAPWIYDSVKQTL